MAYINDKNLPYLVEKLSNADNIKINNNKHGSRVSTVINSLVTKSDNVTKALEQEIINDSYSFKVGTGDVNVSADVQDGFGEIGIKGVTYQNILGTRINPSDGVEKNNNTITFNKVAQTRCTAGFPDSLAQVDKTYTLIFDILENTIENPANGNVGKINIVSYNSGNYFIKYKETGHKKILLKQPATSTGKPYVEFYHSTSGKFVMTTPILLEGDHTNNPNLPSYFEGIVGVGDKSKNLLNPSLHDGLLDFGNYFMTNKSYGSCNEVTYSLKPNTNYTLSFKKYGEGNCWIGVVINGEYANNNNYPSFSKTITTDSTGVITLKLGANTPSDTSSKIYNLQLRESNSVLNYEPYYDGHKIEILSNGKNLYKPNLQTKSANGLTFTLLGDNQLIVNGTCTKITDFRPINGSQTPYLADFVNNILRAGTTLALSNNLGLTNYFSVKRNNQIQYPVNKITKQNGDDIACFVRFEEGQSYNNQQLNIQLEINSKATEFEPYVEDKTQILLDEPLMRLPNGVCDEITRDGKLIRRVGKIVLNGSEDYIASSSSENTMYFILKNLIAKKGGYCISNNFYFEIGSNDNEHIRLNANGNIVFWIKISKLASQDSAGVKQWLSQNPTTVYYELAEPIATELPAPCLRIFKDGHITFNTLVAPESTHVVQLNKSAQIERSIREVQSLDNRVGQLESFYDNMMLETSYKLNLLNYDFEYTKEREDE